MEPTSRRRPGPAKLFVRQVFSFQDFVLEEDVDCASLRSAFQLELSMRGELCAESDWMNPRPHLRSTAQQYCSAD